MNKRKKIVVSSKAELAKLLMEGNKLYHSYLSNSYAHYDESKTTPFRFGDGYLGSYWNEKEWYIEQDWRDVVSPDNPVLCWVSDTEENPNKDCNAGLELVKKFERGKYKGMYTWYYATPLTKEEALSLVFD